MHGMDVQKKAELVLFGRQNKPAASSRHTRNATYADRNEVLKLSRRRTAVIDGPDDPERRIFEKAV
jgi:hypothetical protein